MFFLKTLRKNPEAPIFCLVFSIVLFRLSNIFVILFMRLDARLRRGGAVLYLSFNEYFRCPPICPLAVHRVCLVLISPPPPLDGCDRVVFTLVGIHAYRPTRGYIE